MVAANGLYQSVRNFELVGRVNAALLNFEEERFDCVSVIAFCGIVELTGTVSNYYDRSFAIRIAEHVQGVTTVVESLQIRPTHRDEAARIRGSGQNFIRGAFPVS